MTNSTECFNFHGSNFGAYEHSILDSCPIARSLGEIVSSGRPFVWMPGELPYFAEGGKKPSNYVDVVGISSSLTVLKKMSPSSRRAFKFRRIVLRPCNPLLFRMLLLQVRMTLL